MKPKPFCWLNHFTVPDAILGNPFLDTVMRPALCGLSNLQFQERGSQLGAKWLRRKATSSGRLSTGGYMDSFAGECKVRHEIKCRTPCEGGRIFGSLTKSGDDGPLRPRKPVQAGHIALRRRGEHEGFDPHGRGGGHSDARCLRGAGDGRDAAASAG